MKQSSNKLTAFLPALNDGGKTIAKYLLPSVMALSGVAYSASSLASTTGEQKTLVLMVNFQENPAEQPMTSAEARELMFGTINDYYKANSYGQLWFTGEVGGLVTVPLSNQDCNTSYILEEEAKKQAQAKGIDLSGYTRFVYLTTGDGCATEGSATTSSLPSRVIINGAREPRVLAHELGHNLGLRHANALNCTDGVLGGSCRTISYGDSYDTMGNDDMGYFSTFQKERLGWMTSSVAPEISVAERTGTYSLGAYEENDGQPIAIKIPRGPDANGKQRWLYVEYRQAIAHDDFLADRSYSFFRDDVTAGIVVRQATEGDAYSSQLLHMKPNSYYEQQTGYKDWGDPALPVGGTFTDPESGATISLISAQDGKAEVSVTFGQTSCAAQTPSLSATPLSSTEVSAGAQVSYKVSVTNRDSNSCGTSTIDVRALLPQGWYADSEQVSLAPGESVDVTLSVTSAVDAAANTYPLTINASNSDKVASTQVAYTVISSSGELPITPVLKANDDQVAITSLSSVIVDVMANDTLSEPETVRLVTVSGASKGSVELLSDGTVRYTPGKRFKNSDSFSYTISDGITSATANVSIALQKGDTGGGATKPGRGKNK
ncbi:Ig-like domain-containing protein [Pseudoalteromonas sp. T1lg10]|uniref:Ig-like domain-containing protein n=1 Tax=Pseudoalteromonas sp. T1lg10 TaxID=2077093 RepID=UPI000CF693B2|nr:cadherin-like domain-containing protein [Pseudoalteromonas sp. T1lg10]